MNSSISISVSILKKNFLNISFNFNTKEIYSSISISISISQIKTLNLDFNINMLNFLSAISIPPRFQYFFNISISISIFGSISIVLLIPATIVLGASHKSFALEAALLFVNITGDTCLALCFHCLG